MKQYSIYTAALLMAFVSGCQKEDIKNGISEERTFKVETNVISRSQTFSKDFNLFIDQEGEDMDYDMVMKNENGSWESYTKAENTPLEMKWKDASPVPVTAVYIQFQDQNPVNVNEMVKHTIFANQSDANFDVENEDVLYYNETVSDQRPTLTVNFKHLLSTIEIKPEGMPENVTVQSLKIKNVKNQYTWTPAQGIQSFSATGNPVDITLKPVSDVYKCILPSQYLDAVELYVTYSDGKTQTQKFNSATIESGIGYEVTNFKYNPDAQSDGLSRSAGEGLILEVKE